MANEDERALARKIMELSDRISEQGRKILDPSFVPTPEFIRETTRLTDLCLALIEESKARIQKQGDDS